jgi:hypothetical protein
MDSRAREMAETLPCDFCNKEISIGSPKCPYCGRDQIESILERRDWPEEDGEDPQGMVTDNKETISTMKLASPSVILGRLSKAFILQFPFLTLISGLILVIGVMLNYFLDVAHLSLLNNLYDPSIGGSGISFWNAIFYGSAAMLFCCVMASIYGPQQRTASAPMLWSKTVPAVKGEIINDYSGQQRSWVLAGIYCFLLIFFPFILLATVTIGVSVFIIVRIS